MMEAMNALVLMDPRMDTGHRAMLDRQSSGRAVKEVDITQLEVDVESACAIMDRLMAAEVGI